MSQNNYGYILSGDFEFNAQGLLDFKLTLNLGGVIKQITYVDTDQKSSDLTTTLDPRQALTQLLKLSKKTSQRDIYGVPVYITYNENEEVKSFKILEACIAPLRA